MKKATRPSDLRTGLDRFGIRPRRTLGQNFLIDGNTADRIVDALSMRPGERVLEIGPGAGALTERLIERGARVTAIEKDDRLAALLRERFDVGPGCELRVEDALETDFSALFRGGIAHVISNLPYASGSRIFVNLLFADPAPERMVLTLQTEVADRIAAGPGTRDYGLLSVWTAWRYRVEPVRTIAPTCFYPPPEVQSSVIRLVRQVTPRADIIDPDHFRALTRWAFGGRRKQMGSMFRRLPPGLGRVAAPSDAWLRTAGVDPAARPGDLPVETWAGLSNRLLLPE